MQTFEVESEASVIGEGVSFAAVLTIDASQGRAPVLQELQQLLQADAINKQSLQTAVRIRPRR